MIQEIIDRYKYFVEKHEWTIIFAAEKIGCHRTHLSNIFHGRRIPSMTLLNEMERIMEKYGE